MARKDWDYNITNKDLEKVKSVNENIVDVHKATSGGAGKSTGKGGSTKPTTVPPTSPTPPTPPAPGAPGGPGAPAPGTPAPGGKVSAPTTPATPPPSSGGSPKGPSSAGPKIGGGHSLKTSRVRGIENTFAGKINFIDASSFVRSGGAWLTNEEVKASRKWAEFRDVYSHIRKNIDRLKKEEISDITQNHIIGNKINMRDYISGKDKWFDRVDVPERNTQQVNIIIALDVSGSTGVDRAYNMSGLTLAVVKALEYTKVQHSVIMYNHKTSILEVDNRHKSSNTNILAADVVGSGGNEEGPVLDIASEIARKNQDKTNVLLYISDGGVANISGMIEKYKTKNKNNPFNVYCLGYSSDFDELYAKEVFGSEFAIGAMNNKDFANKILRVLSYEIDKVSRQ